VVIAIFFVLAILLILYVGVMGFVEQRRAGLSDYVMRDPSTSMVSALSGEQRSLSATALAQTNVGSDVTDSAIRVPSASQQIRGRKAQRIRAPRGSQRIRVPGTSRDGSDFALAETQPTMRLPPESFNASA
jgi:hypothetical protein